MLRYKLFFLLFLSIGFFTGPILAQTCAITSVNPICQGTSSTLAITTDISTPTSYTWNNSLVGSTINVSPTATTNYSCIVSNGTATCTTAVFTLTVNPTPNVITQTQTICSAGTFTVSPANGSGNIVPTGTSYSWSAPSVSGITGTASGSNASSISGTLTNTTNEAINVVYTVTPTSGSCPGASFTVTVTVSPKPSVVAQIQTICSAGIFTVSPTDGSGNIVPTGTSYSWTAPSVSGITGTASGSSASSISGTLTNTTNAAINVEYTVTPKSGSCTGSSFTVTVIVKPVPSIANNNQSVCSNANYLGNWTIPDIVPLNTLYTWSVTNNTQVIGETNNTILQTFGQTLTNLTFLDQSVSYTITPTTNGCTGLPFTLNLEVKPAPLANAGADFSKTCIQNISGAMIGASAIPGYTYAWTTTIGLSDSNISNPIANPVSTTIYTITVTDLLSTCSSKDSVNVSVNNTVPIVNAGVDGTITCNQNTNGFTIGSQSMTGLNYSWTPIIGLYSTNSSSSIALPNQTTTYTQTVINTSNGCTATDQVLVTVNNSVPLASAGNDGLITCITNPSGLLIGMTAVAGNTYSWSPTTNLTSSLSASTTANPSATTTYTLTTTSSNGCTATDQVIVTVNNSVPIANAGADFTKTCTLNPNGATIGTTAISGNTYSWSPTNNLTSSSAANPIANPTATSTYTLTTTNSSNGCTATDQVIVTVNNSLPTVNAGTNDTICNGSSIALSGASNANNIVWTPSSLVSNPGSLTPSANIQGNTTFTLTATGLNGCTNSDFVIITVNDLPQSGLSNNYEICTNNNLQLNVSPNLTCQWNGLLNSTLNSINQIVDSSGTIILEITDNNNCSTTEEITINLLPIPYPIITGAGQLCQNSYWEEYSVPSTSNYIQWSIINGEFLSPNNSNTVFVHWLNGNSGQILVTETIAATGCNNEYFINVLLDASLALDTTEILMLSSNVLYTTEDYSFMNWGYESIVTHIPVSVGVYSQYCNYNNIDLSSYYYWVEIGNGNGCITKSYFNYPTFTANIENQSIDEFIVFPNPTDDIITIKTNFDSSGYQLQSINGSVVKSGIGNHEFSINIIDLPSGVYFLNLDNGNRNYRTKILKL